MRIPRILFGFSFILLALYFSGCDHIDRYSEDMKILRSDSLTYYAKNQAITNALIKSIDEEYSKEKASGIISDNRKLDYTSLKKKYALISQLQNSWLDAFIPFLKKEGHLPLAENNPDAYKPNPNLTQNLDEFQTAACTFLQNKVESDGAAKHWASSTPGSPTKIVYDNKSSDNTPLDVSCTIIYQNVRFDIDKEKHVTATIDLAKYISDRENAVQKAKDANIQVISDFSDKYFKMPAW